MLAGYFNYVNFMHFGNLFENGIKLYKVCFTVKEFLLKKNRK